MNNMSGSMRVRQDRRNQVLDALNRSNYDGQEGLAQAADLAQATVSNFFRCIPVRRANFKKLCELLKLDAKDVREPGIVDPTDSEDPINPIVDDKSRHVSRLNEEIWERELLKQYALVKIQAPSGFGKTTLMLRMLDRARNEGHLTIYLNLDDLNLRSISSANGDRCSEFWRESIAEIEMQIPDEYVNSLMSIDRYEQLALKLGQHSRAYLKYLEHLQKVIHQPLTLAINKLDILLEYPELAGDFFRLLRQMNEKSKISKNWAGFRLAIAYTTPCIQHFIPLNLNESPFGNVGFPIELLEFELAETIKLFELYDLSLSAPQIQGLIQLIGGIPSLLILIIQKINTHSMDILNSILVDSSTAKNIYREHLLSLDKYLAKYDLRSIMEEVATTPEQTANIPLKQKCQLHRRGLVVFTDNNRIGARCKLYHQYFLPNFDK